MIVWFVTIAVLGLRWISADIRRSWRRSTRCTACSFFAAQRLARLRRARLGVPRRDRRRGALRRHGALRHAARSASPGSASCCRRCSSTTSARARCCSTHPASTRSTPFYLMAPRWALYPLVALATMAAIIASQALISGAFSLTRQAIQLGYCPRLDIQYTRPPAQQGQIYMPQVNWVLMIATHRSRARLPSVERARRGVRHRRHLDDGDHDAAGLPGGARVVGRERGRSLDRSALVLPHHRARLLRRQRASRSRTAAGSRWSSALSSTSLLLDLEGGPRVLLARGSASGCIRSNSSCRTSPPHRRTACPGTAVFMTSNLHGHAADAAAQPRAQPGAARTRACC